MDSPQVNTTQLSPSIYFGSLDANDLKEFDALTITLDAKLDSSLKWTDKIQQAKDWVQKGFRILWQLNFGLFHELPLPLSDTAQYRSLHLALDHFFDVVLSAFSDHTLGVVLYQGALDLAHHWSWENDQVLNFRGWLSEEFVDHHAFTNLIGLPCQNLLTVNPKDLYALENGKNLLRHYCMQTAVDYLSMLAARFETNLLPYVLLDSAAIRSSAHAFQLLDHEDFELIQLALKNLPFTHAHAVGWESIATANGYIGQEYKSYQKPLLEPNTAIVIPSKKLIDHQEISKYDEAIEQVKQFKPIKLISERHITTEWQGIDDLIVFDVALASRRKLEGFVAAGGRIISSQKLGLAHEIAWLEFMNLLKEKK